MIHVVEDDAGVRELELYALRTAGYEASGFGEPAEFRRALQEELPELVILDVMLPGEDGMSLLRSIRHDARTRRLPVILVTAPGSPFLLTRGILYTAITRARELLIIVGREETVAVMTQNAKKNRRYSGLKLRLQGKTE